MYCNQCGALALDGAKFCAKCGGALPSSHRAPQVAEEPGAVQASLPFRGTRIMNIVGAAGLGLLGIALFFNKLGSVPTAVLVVIVLFYSILFAVPMTTILALSNKAGNAPRILALGLNIALIVLWCVSLIGALLIQPRSMFLNLAGALMFVVPEWINIRALRALLKRN
jgi:hypothetical protein